jgi:hypothetical protein
MIKIYLQQLSLEKAQKSGGDNIISERILDKLNYNSHNKLLSLVDAKIQDYQFEFWINTIHVIQAALQSNFVIKGLNLNMNPDLTDRSLKSLLNYVKAVRSIKVLSIERMHISHQGIQQLFNKLPETRIIELNLSGIPLNLVCIDTLCNVMQSYP